MFQDGHAGTRHQHLELSMKERRTTAMAADRLRAPGLDHSPRRSADST